MQYIPWIFLDIYILFNARQKKIFHSRYTLLGTKTCNLNQLTQVHTKQTFNFVIEQTTLDFSVFQCGEARVRTKELEKTKQQTRVNMLTPFPDTRQPTQPTQQPPHQRNQRSEEQSHTLNTERPSSIPQLFTFTFTCLLVSSSSSKLAILKHRQLNI